MSTKEADLLADTLAAATRYIAELQDGLASKDAEIAELRERYRRDTGIIKEATELMKAAADRLDPGGPKVCEANQGTCSLCLDLEQQLKAKDAEIAELRGKLAGCSITVAS